MTNRDNSQTVAKLDDEGDEVIIAGENVLDLNQMETILLSIRALLKARDNELISELNAFHNDIFRRGVGIQSFTIKAMGEICGRAIEPASLAAWKRMEELLRNPLPDYSLNLVFLLKQELRSTLPAPTVQFESFIESISVGRPEEMQRAIRRHIEEVGVHNSLQTSQLTGLRHVDAEIERFGREVLASTKYKKLKPETFKETKTDLDRVVEWFMNKRVLVAVAILFLVVKYVGQFLDSCVELFGILKEPILWIWSCL